MSEIITAIYENGVLRPLSALPLPENSTVRLQLVTEDTASEAEQVMQSLAAAGLVKPPPRSGDVQPVSEETWRELMQRLKASSGKPLSEIIIEERGPWCELSPDEVSIQQSG